MSKHVTKRKLDEGLEQDRTGLERLAVMRDEDIDYSDIPELDASFWANAELVMPELKGRVTVRIDHDVLAWLRRRGQSTRLESTRSWRGAYMEAHKR